MESTHSRRGRFAPSPTGPLHFGSLVTAVASYLDAKSMGGEWLVRMEDVDIFRTVPEADALILQSLEAHGLEWDGEAMVQSERTGVYRSAFQHLGTHVYPCGCSRKIIADLGEGRYPGTCRRGLAPGVTARSYRLIVSDDRLIEFHDRLQGSFQESLAKTCGDFVILRADRIFAYQLAVVVDDAAQRITDVVRGADLLDSTARQVYLHELLGFQPIPRYLHLPVVCDQFGKKLSKQTNAPPLNNSRAAESLWKTLYCLSQRPPVELRGAPPRELLAWGIRNWDASRLNGQRIRESP